MVEAYWSVVEEDKLIVISKWVKVYSNFTEIKRVWWYYSRILVQDLRSKRSVELNQTLVYAIDLNLDNVVDLFIISDLELLDQNTLRF